MDLQDLQDDCRSDLQYGDITEKIISCAFEVINELGAGFLESVYAKALAVALQEKVHPVLPWVDVLLLKSENVM